MLILEFCHSTQLYGETIRRQHILNHCTLEVPITDPNAALIDVFGNLGEVEQAVNTTVTSPFKVVMMKNIKKLLPIYTSSI